MREYAIGRTGPSMRPHEQDGIGSLFQGSGVSGPWMSQYPLGPWVQPLRDQALERPAATGTVAIDCNDLIRSGRAGPPYGGVHFLREQHSALGIHRATAGHLLP